MVIHILWPALREEISAGIVSNEMSESMLKVRREK